MKNAIFSGLSRLWTSGVNVKNGMILSGLLAFGSSHFALAQCPPVEPYIAPYYMTFEGLANSSTSGNTTLANCWILSNQGSYGWFVDAGGTPSGSTGPSVDNTTQTSAGKYLALETSSPASLGDSSYAEIPLVNIDNLTSPELVFYYHKYGSTMGDLIAQVDGGSGWTTVWTMPGQTQTSGFDPYAKATVPLSAYSGAISVRFIGVRGTSYFGDMAIDDVSIADPAACAAVQNLSAIDSATTASSIDITWDAGDSLATSWDITYGAPGFAVGTGTSLTVTTTTASISGLSANTAYEFRVSELCVGSSLYSPPAATGATTLCSPVATWTEDFDSYATGSGISKWGCFEKVGTSGFVYATTNTTAPSQPNYYYQSGSSTAPVTVLLPPTTNQGAGTHRLELTGRAGSTAGCQIALGVLTDPSDASTFVVLDSVVIPYTAFGTYDPIVLNVRPHNAANGALAIQSYSYWYSDDWSWVAIPQCEDPLAVANTGATVSTLDFSWTHSGGNAQSFNIEYGPSGFTQGTGSTMTTTGTSVQLTGLTSNTLYDVYVQADCGGSGISGWSSPGTARTSCVTLAMPYLEGFDGVWPPDCWNIDGGTQIPSQYANDYMEASFWSWSSGNFAVATSPVINLTADARASFAWSHLYSTSYPGDQLILRVAEAGTSNWDTIKNLQGPSFSAPGAGNTAPAATFVPEIMVLDAALTGKDVVFEFIFNSGWGPDCFVDDFVVEAVPSCVEPASLSASNIGTVSFDISWVSADNDFNVEWGPAGYGQGTGSTFTVTGTQGTTTVSVNVFGQGSTTALTPNTSYDVYVQTNCGASTSSWEGPLTVTTECLETAPWSDDFESLSTGTADRFGCWGQDQSISNPRWYADNGGTPSSNTGPTVDNTTGTSTGMYMFLETSGGAGDTNSLVSSVIDVTALTTPYLEFYYHMFGATMGDLHVDVYDDINGWQRDVVLLSGQLTASQTASYDKADATLTSGASMVQIRFRAQSGSSFTSDMAIDDVSISEAPACLDPGLLNITAVTDSSFDFSWTSTGTDFNVEYGPVGFGQGTGATFSVQGTTTASVYGQGSTTAIMANTSYDVYVQNDCGNATSGWVGPLTVTTLCAPVAMPYTEGFDGTSWPPACWDLDNGSFTPVQSGNDYMEAAFWSFSAGNVAYAVSPTIDITSNARVMFSWAHLYSTAYPNDALTLRVAEAGTSNWDTLQYLQGANFTSPNAQNTTPPTGGDADFINEIIILDPSYTGKKVVLEFVFASGWGPNCFIDDFVVEKVPDCPEPGALSASQVIGTSGTISWAAANNAVDYNVEYGPSGFAQGTGTIITTPDTFTVISGLTTTTSYDVYVQTNCASDNSVWQGPITFTTTVSCPAPVLSGAFVWPNQIQFNWTPNISASYVQWAIIPNGTAISAAVLNTDTNSGTARDSSLTPSTAYTVWLRDSCGPGDVSAWATFNVTTSCAPTAAPYFDDYDLFVNAANGIIGSENCWWWNQNYTGGPFWRTISGGTASGNTGPTAGSGGSGQYMYLETSTGPGSAEVWSPDLDISGMSNPELSFEYHMFGATMGTLEVSIVADTLNTVIWSISGQQQNSGSDPWLEASVDLSPYLIYGVVEIRFSGNRNGSFTGDMAVDNFSVDEAPLCMPVMNLSASNIDASSATLSWSSADPAATSWEVEYGPAGFTQGSGTMVTVTDTFYNITGLTNGAVYKYYVSEICSNGNGNSPSMSGNFTTPLCAPANSCQFTVIMGDTYGDGWSGTVIGIEQNGVIVDAFGSSFNNGYGDTTTVTLCDGYATNVVVQNPGTWSDEASFDIIDPSGATVASWASGSAVTAAQNLGSFTASCSVAPPPPSCALVTGLNETNVTNFSARLEWVGDSAHQQWYVEYGPAGFTQGSGTSVTANKERVNLTCLNSASGYDYYVRGLCATGDTSAPVLGNFTTLALPCFGVDSIQTINAKQGAYRVYFAPLVGDNFRLKYAKSTDMANPRTKSIGGALQGLKGINTSGWQGSDVVVWMEVEQCGTWLSSVACSDTITIPCKPQTLSMVEQLSPTCAADSVLVRAGYAGGYGAPNILWSNGATTKRTFASQGEKLTVTITDAAGCSVTDSITASTLDDTAVPGNFALTKGGATIYVANFTAATLPTGANLIGYRMAYRLRGTQNWTNTPLSQSTTISVDFTGTGLAAGNYEFVVYTRYRLNGVATNSEFTCREAKGYNGSGNKSGANAANGSDAGVVSIYPNPAKDVLYVAAAAGAEVSLLDMSGKLIASQIVEGAEVDFDISHLAQGVYMVRVQTNDEIITEQVVKH
jgi:hypothetical protein